VGDGVRTVHAHTHVRNTQCHAHTLSRAQAHTLAAAHRHCQARKSSTDKKDARQRAEQAQAGLRPPCPPPPRAGKAAEARPRALPPSPSKPRPLVRGHGCWHRLPAAGRQPRRLFPAAGRRE
jgi:hypothetical protein